MTLRRDLLTALPVLALGASAAKAAPARDATTGAVSREAFDQYILLYNAADPAFTQFYHDSIVMEVVPPLSTAAAIWEFRRELSFYVREQITVEYYIADETGAAAQCLTEFTCVRDLPANALSGLFGTAAMKGQVLRQRGVTLYGARNAKFSFIRASPPIKLQDWS